MANAPKFELDKLINSQNIAEFLPQDYLDGLGVQVVLDTARDRASRQDWEERHAKAVKLALQVQETKSFPWTNCSNVKFPLLTIAVLQFLARISVMTKGKNLANVQVLGVDRDGSKGHQSRRLSRHLSLQLIEEDTNWRDSDEQAKFAACLLGSSFKKTYPDLIEGKNTSEHVPSMDFIVDYTCKDINKAQRLTHVIQMTGNKLQENARSGMFLELRDDLEPTLPSESNVMHRAEQEASGVRPVGGDTNDTYEILEQHCWLDLDGDGYKEPYIVSVRHDTNQVLRVVARFSEEMVHRKNDMQVRLLEQKIQAAGDMKIISALEKQASALQDAADNHIIRIDPMLYFTRLLFIPSPDGGVYGLGLGALLGPLNEAVDTLTNQQIDAGTMSTTAGGFLGRGVKLKGGKNSFDPFEWKPVDSNGQDLRANIFPLPVRDPSPVLFQLLGMLVSYSEKVSGATDIMTGVSPGQNTPAETSRNTVEQGMMLFSGIYARMYRGFTEELNKLVNLNKLFLPLYPSFHNLTTGEDAVLLEDDYTKHGLRVLPAVSPEITSTSQRREKAGAVLQLSEREPGFNKYLVVKDFLEAWEIDNIDDIYPDPQGKKAIPPAPNLKMEELKFQQQKHAAEMQLAIVTLQKEIRLNDAKVMELQAKATKELAEAKGVDTGHQIALLNTQIAAEKTHNEKMKSALTILQNMVKDEQAAQSQQQKEPASAGASPAAPSQPAI